MTDKKQIFTFNKLELANIWYFLLIIIIIFLLLLFIIIVIITWTIILFISLDTRNN